MDEFEIQDPAPTPDALMPARTTYRDAHAHWHDAFDGYHDPDAFRRAIEPCIQELRNVTFRLQSAKNDFPFPFDEWYGPWQDLMKADEILRWLNDARIEVVKRSGLSTNSFCLVRSIDSYLESEHVLLRLSAGTPTFDVVERAIKSIPDQYRQHIAIEISRRWIAGDRMEREILGLLAHCFWLLDAVLQSASEYWVDGEASEPDAFAASVLPPFCMLVDPSALKLYFEADTGDRFSLATEAVEFDPELGDEAARRYGGRRPEQFAITATDLLERAEKHHEIARRLFKKDGHHLPITYLREPDGQWQIFSGVGEGKRFKFLWWHTLGEC